MLRFKSHFNSLLHSLMFPGGIAMQHVAENGLKSSLANTVYKNPKF